MLNGVKVKSLYATLQRQLFYMIPEKWDRIYLYAAVSEKMNHLETGEMFFYYYPKGLLKKNPVNVYEVPSKFNIDEEAYMKLVNELYNTIQLLRKEFEKAGEKVWTNLTVSIENLKFRVEYDYTDLEKSGYSSYDQHIIWQYKYLDLAIERLSKKDRIMLENYIEEEQFQNKETKKHMENMYEKNTHNNVEYDKVETPYSQENQNNNLEEKTLDHYELYKLKSKEEKTPDRYELYKEQSEKEKSLDKYELYKLKKEQEKQKEREENEKLVSSIEQKEETKNQILNFKP